jgi:hypothetical protein
MPRVLLIALLAAATAALGAAPALAVAVTPPAAHAATADDCDPDVDADCAPDPGDEWDEEDPGDEDMCVDDACPEDDVCDEEAGDDEGQGDDLDDDWGDDEAFAATATSEDDEWTCEEDAAAEPEPAPRISRLHAAPARHGRGGARVNVKFRLDRAGQLTLSLERVGAKGARRRCGTAGGRCTTATRLRGTLELTGRAGANATTLRRWNGRRLTPGSYRLTVTPTVAGGRPVTTSFAVVPARARRR